MNTKYNNKKGFTLLEIMIVVAIITILAGVAFFNISSSISEFRDRAEMLSIRNEQYGYFEPGAQFEAEQRLNFRNYISEMRSLSGDPNMGVIPENAAAEGENPAGGSSVENSDTSVVDPGTGGGSGSGEGEDSGEVVPPEDGGEDPDPDEVVTPEGVSTGGGSYSNRISGLSSTGNRISFNLSDGGGNNIALSITRNGDDYVMSGCGSGMQWILEGHGGAPRMPGYDYNISSYTLNDAQIAWLADNYGVDVTAIGGEGGGSSVSGGGETETEPAVTTPVPTTPAGTNAAGSNIVSTGNWWNGRLTFDSNMTRCVVVVPEGSSLQMDQWQYNINNLGGGRYEISLNTSNGGASAQRQVTIRVDNGLDGVYIESFS